MKGPLMIAAFIALTWVAALAPTRSTPPTLLSDADEAGWECSRSALIVTTCAPHRDVRLAAMH